MDMSIREYKMNIKVIQLKENKTALQKYFIQKFLRIARKENDIEKINHFVFGKLKQFGVNFTEIT